MFCVCVWLCFIMDWTILCSKVSLTSCMFSDVTIDVDVLTLDQMRDVNMCAAQYGMKDDDFIR